MPKLKRETIEKRYRKINDLYEQFTYEITQYGIDWEYNKHIAELVGKLRLELKKII